MLPTDPYTAFTRESMREAMAAAIDSEETVKVAYVKPGNRRATVRHFAPGVLSRTQDGETIVTGHDFKRDDARSFRLDRMRWVERNPVTQEA